MIRSVLKVGSAETAALRRRLFHCLDMGVNVRGSWNTEADWWENIPCRYYIREGAPATLAEALARYTPDPVTRIWVASTYLPKDQVSVVAKDLCRASLRSAGRPVRSPEVWRRRGEFVSPTAKVEETVVTTFAVGDTTGWHQVDTHPPW